MSKKKTEFPFEVKSGCAAVKVYKAEKDGYTSYTIGYYVQGRRKRKVLAGFQKALAEAKRIVAQLAAGHHRAITLRDQDLAEPRSGLSQSNEKRKAMIDHIYLPVSDLKRSSEFYKTVNLPSAVSPSITFRVSG